MAAADTAPADDGPDVTDVVIAIAAGPTFDLDTAGDGANTFGSTAIGAITIANLDFDADGNITSISASHSGIASTLTGVATQTIDLTAPTNVAATLVNAKEIISGESGTLNFTRCCELLGEEDHRC